MKDKFGRVRLEEMRTFESEKNMRFLNGAIEVGRGKGRREKLEAETIKPDDPLVVSCSREGEKGMLGTSKLSNRVTFLVLGSSQKVVCWWLILTWNVE